MSLKTWSCWGINRDGEVCQVPVVLEYNTDKPGQMEWVNKFKQDTITMMLRYWDGVKESENEPIAFPLIPICVEFVLAVADDEYAVDHVANAKTIVSRFNLKHGR